MKLDDVPTGSTCSVIDCICEERLKHRLETMGVVEGARLFVHNRSFGNVIIEVKNARIALGGDIARRIEVCE